MLCKFCTTSQTAPYVCPQCAAPYCSVACYKSGDHLQCSELFYKRCAEEQFRPGASRKSDVETVKKALSRHLRERQEESESEFLARFSGIDITDADLVMKVLTAEERETFSNLLASERMAEFMPCWTPWWYKKSKMVEEVDRRADSDALQDYKPQKKIARNKIGGRKVHPVGPTRERIGRDSKIVGDKSAAEGNISSESPDATVEDVGERTIDEGEPKRTLIVDARYKSRKPSSSETSKEPGNSGVKPSTQPAETPPFSRQNVSLGDEVFNHPKLISPIFRTKCANLLNLITSFAFTARYYNGDFKELVEEAGEILCSTSLIFEQKECHEVPIAIGDVLSRPVVLENGDRVSLIEDVQKICYSKQFVQRALVEIGELLKEYGKYLKKGTDPDSTARKQRVHKFRYKVYFYIEWIDGSFSQFREYCIPLVDLLSAES